MNLQGQRPAWVIEQVLDSSPFACCGDQDLFPFKCSACALPLVLCYECDTLFPELSDLRVQLPFVLDTSRCPNCAGEFSPDFMRSPQHRISFAEWSGRGHDQLLASASAQDLLGMLANAAEVLSGFLSRGMLSTAKIRIVEFRNLAEALAALVSNAESLRVRGQEIAAGSTLREALAWHATIADRTGRAYAVLGITDTLFPST